MWENYIGQQMRRCNRNLLIVNLLILGCFVAYAYSNGRYLWNFLSGPADISNAELAGLRDAGERARFFVRVQGGQSFDTGLQSVEQTVDKYSRAVRSTTVKADYRIVTVGDKFLVVKADPAASGAVFRGALEPLPAWLYEQIVAPLIKDEPRLEGRFVPAMLNANDFREQGWWTVGIGLPLLLLIGWNLWKWRERTAHSSAHPIFKRISRFGAAEQVAEQIQMAARMNPAQKIGKVRLFGPWLFRESFFGLTCFHLPDLVWMYQKVTKHSVNFIPTGKTYDIVLNDRYRVTAEISASKTIVEPLMAQIAGQSPWIAVGFSDELRKLWTSQPAEFIAAIDQRRNEATGAAAAGH